MKRKLEEAKGKWVEELPSVLWMHRTTVRKSTGETPFALAYGVEAVIPLEVGMPTTRTTEFVVETNEDNLRERPGSFGGKTRPSRSSVGIISVADKEGA
jgi:hypothetical protein